MHRKPSGATAALLGSSHRTSAAPDAARQVTHEAATQAEHIKSAATEARRANQAIKVLPARRDRAAEPTAAAKQGKSAQRRLPPTIMQLQHSVGGLSPSGRRSSSCGLGVLLLDPLGALKDSTRSRPLAAPGLSLSSTAAALRVREYGPSLARILTVLQQHGFDAACVSVIQVAATPVRRRVLALTTALRRSLRTQSHTVRAAGSPTRRSASVVLAATADHSDVRLRACDLSRSRHPQLHGCSTY
jgi:hypothetical protein